MGCRWGNAVVGLLGTTEQHRESDRDGHFVLRVTTPGTYMVSDACGGAPAQAVRGDRRGVVQGPDPAVVSMWVGSSRCWRPSPRRRARRPRTGRDSTGGRRWAMDSSWRVRSDRGQARDIVYADPARSAGEDSPNDAVVADARGVRRAGLARPEAACRMSWMACRRLRSIMELPSAAGRSPGESRRTI